MSVQSMAASCIYTRFVDLQSESLQIPEHTEHWAFGGFFVVKTSARYHQRSWIYKDLASNKPVQFVS